MLKKLFSLSFLQLFCKLIALYQVLLIARMTTVPEFGMYSVIISLTLLLSVVFSGGMSDFIIKTLSDTNDTRKLVLRPILISLVLAFLVSPIIYTLYIDEYNVFIVAIIIFISFSRAVITAIVGNLTYKNTIYYTQLLLNVVPVLLIFSYVLFIYITLGEISIQSFLIYQLLVWLIILGLLALKLHKISKDNIEEKFELKKYSTYYIFSIVSILNLEGVTIIIDQFSSESGVALFRIAFLGSTLIPIVLNVAVVYLSPKIANHKYDIEIIGYDARILTKKIFYIMLPIILISVVLSKDALILFLGNDYLDSSLLYNILALGQIINIALGFPGVFLSLTGNASALTKATLKVGLLSFLILIFLTYKFDSIGAAIGVSISLILQKIYISHIAYKMLGIKTWI